MVTDGLGTREQVSFGTLLKRFRLAAGLSQEGLAERARLSARAISAYEREVRRVPYRDTVRLLVEALGLSAPDAATLEATVPRRRRLADPPTSGSPPRETFPPCATIAAAPSAPAVDLPTGALTFLSTEIVDSTTLWEQHPAAMDAAIARHDALINAALTRYGGRQVQERGDGDSILAVFSSPTAALAAVCALQQALLAEPWPPETALRVRMGLHTGEAHPRDGSYHGAVVNRAARIRSLAHGGQILFSEATYDLVRDGLPEGVSLRALGAHGLKGLRRPEVVYQVLHPHLPAEFPPLSSPQAPKTNLPVQVTSFVGRERELAAVLDLLDHSRLVTLTGAGGSGKTRLALQVATELLGEFPDGVFLVALAPITDPGLVAATIAQALGIQEAEGRSFADNLKSYLRERRMLLLLDNFEQVIAAAPLVAEVLGHCPHPRILVTSRAALHLRGEQEYSVPPLALPDPRVPPLIEPISRCAAVALFIQRTVNVRADFQVTDDNAPVVAEICRRLDGLPLAIELAAARGKLLSPEALLARLEHRLTLLTGGARDLPARQRTLRDAIAWSYDLLDAREQRLFRRLSVFAGGCGLAMAEAVCNVDGDLGVDVLNGVTALMDNSLLWNQAPAGASSYSSESEPRLTMLETIREYGLECLEASGEAERTRQRHARVFLRLAEEAEAKLQEVEAKTWLSRLDAEYDNLRAALTWSLGGGEIDIGLRLAAALGEFWRRMGYLSEGRGWIERALACPGPRGSTQAASAPAAQDEMPPSERQDLEARLLERLGDFLGVSGRHQDARSAYQQALVSVPDDGKVRRSHLYRKTGTTWGNQQDYVQAVATYDVAEDVLGPEPAQDVPAWRSAWIDIQLDRIELLYWLGHWPRIIALREQIEPVVLAVGTLVQRAAFHDNLGVECQRARYVVSDEIVASARAALTAWQAVGDVRRVANSRFMLGFCLLWRGALDEAEEHLGAALETVERTGSVTDLAKCLTYLIILYRKRGMVEEVRRLSRQCVAVARETGAERYAGTAIANLAWVAWCDGNFTEAQAHGDAALDIWRNSPYPLQWTALWPLLALALIRGALAEAIDDARALLAPPQQLLPTALATVLEEAILAEEGGQPAAARASLEGSLELARELRYL
ncbi:MAG TPA: helix-turn-helix domain-containing protein [Chloroflexota bacterium]|nr:helix-turn-helix domain-containing protein [Chloroflexota bacterium]